VVETADIDAIRATAATKGWGILVAAMADRAEVERRDMYAVETTDERRREIANRYAGRQDVLTWFHQQIQKAGGKQ